MIEFREVKLKEIERFRFDAEFYQNSFFELMAKLANTETENLGDIAIIRSGTTPKERDDELSEGVNLLKTNDIRNVPLLKNHSYYKISEETADSMIATNILPNDILMNIVGATLDVVGRVAFVPSDFEKTNITQAMALIRVQDIRFLPEYIFTFLLHSQGNLQARRLARPTGQYNLNLPEVRSIKIPVVSMEKQLKLRDKLIEVEQALREADRILQSADDLLTRELGFENFKWNTNKYSIRSVRKVLLENRFDSEYWQEGYDAIIGVISSYKNGYSNVDAKFKQVIKSFKRQEDTEYQYIEISDINVKSGEIIPNAVLSEDLPANAKIELKDNSLLVSKVRPNRGAIAIAENLNGAIVSGALMTLTQNSDLNLQSLFVYLRLSPIKELLLKYNTGTSYPTITDEVITSLPVPNFPRGIQDEIAKLITDSKSLNRSAQKFLLELTELI